MILLYFDIVKIRREHEYITPLRLVLGAWSVSLKRRSWAKNKQVCSEQLRDRHPNVICWYVGVPYYFFSIIYPPKPYSNYYDTSCFY